MKLTFLALVIAFLACGQALAQTPSKDGVAPAEATAWTRAHLDSLVSVAWSALQSGTSPNKRDPDENRELFRSIGYNGRNVVNYLDAGALVDSVIAEKLIDRALAAHNKTAVLICGNSGAGKGYSINHNPSVKALVDGAGIVYDEVFNDRASLNRTIDHLRQRGITRITQVHVYNDAMTSFVNAANRFVKTGRAIGLSFFLYLYPTYVGYVQANEAEKRADQYIYIDNSGSTDSPRVVTVAEALKWDYTISDALKARMAYFIFEFAKAHDMTYRDTWALLYDE